MEILFLGAAYLVLIAILGGLVGGVGLGLYGLWRLCAWIVGLAVDDHYRASRW